MRAAAIQLNANEETAIVADRDLDRVPGMHRPLPSPADRRPVVYARELA